MSDPKRTWQDISRELASENNRLRCTELSEELTQSMEQEERRKHIAFIAANSERDLRSL